MPKCLFALLVLASTGIDSLAHAASPATHCEASLSNSKLSFKVINGQIDKRSLFFSSPKNPSKNLAADLEMTVTARESGVAGESSASVNLGINIEKFEAAAAEGFDFPSLPACECQEMPKNFDYDTYSLFSKGEISLTFTCNDPVMM
jgi:hypothetical protein